MSRLRRPISLLIAVCAACCVAALLLTAYRAQHALGEAERGVANGERVPFTLRPLDVSTHTTAFEAVPAQPSYRCGAELAGDFYLGGPAGLTVLGADGTVRATLRTGVELPAAPIVAVYTGRLRGAAEPQILLATAGAGVLVMEPLAHARPRLQQLLPAAADAADVSALAVNAGGDLLLGTRHSGVYLFNGSSLQPLALPGVEARHLQVTALAVAGTASVLIGTRTQGVFYTHAGTLQHAGAADGLPDEQVDALAVESDRAFVGTPLGVAQFALPSETFRPVRTLAPGLFAHALAVQGGNLNVGTMDQGIQEIALQSGPRLRAVSLAAQSDTASGRVDQFVAAQGALFALGDGRLLHRAGAGWTAFNAAAPAGSLTDRNVSALAFDDRGSLFVGYFDHGLDVLTASGAVRHLEDDSLFCINRLVLDPRRRTIAAATANGLVLFDSGGAPRQTLTRRDGLLSEHVTDIAFTRAGTVLATPAGLTWLTAEGAESLYAFQGLVNNHVYALAADPTNDHVLAGTLGGLSVLDSATVRSNFTVVNSRLQHNWITALAPTAQGDWLVGTYGAGLQRVSPQGVFTSVDLPAGLPRDVVINPNALLVTATHVYAGTLGHGMLVYSAATDRWRAVTDGLPSRNVTAFAERSGELYIGTENGLLRVAEASL